jgi:hypothetical protein
VNRNRVTVTVLSAAAAWAVWRVHAGAGSLGPLTVQPRSWAASIAIIVTGIVLSYLFIAIAMGGGWRPRT